MKLIQICNFYTYTEFFSSQHFIISHILRLYSIPYSFASSSRTFSQSIGIPSPPSYQLLSSSLSTTITLQYDYPAFQFSLTCYSFSAPITHPYTQAVYLLLPQYPLLLLCHRYILKYLSAQRLLTH